MLLPFLLMTAIYLVNGDLLLKRVDKTALKISLETLENSLQI
jgi:hypothetical protein